MISAEFYTESDGAMKSGKVEETLYLAHFLEKEVKSLLYKEGCMHEIVFLKKYQGIIKTLFVLF